MSLYTYAYPHLALTVDIVVFTVLADKLQVLLIQRRDEPFKDQWALPGGFVHIDEPLESAALRELEEETGIHEATLEQLYTYGEPQRDPRERVVSVAYFSLVCSERASQPMSGSDAKDARWFPIDEVPHMAFDHQEIVSYAMRRLQYKLEYSAVGFQLLPEVFTLSQIQSTYEIILGEKLDKRNFRRRILSASIIEPTESQISGEGRPARLYRYRPDAVAEVKTRRLFP